MGRDAPAYYTPVMAALFFPNPTALRLALANGLVPAAIARASASGGVDSQGHIWIELSEPLSRDALAALHRLGGQVFGKMGVPGSPIRSWAEMLPLEPAALSLDERVTLYVAPDRALARFVARLRRRGTAPLAIHLPHGENSGWVAVSASPLSILSETVQRGSVIESFLEQTPGVWVRCGWLHPLPDQLLVPAGQVLLLRPIRQVTGTAAPVPVPGNEDIVLPRRAPSLLDSRGPQPVVPVRLHLAPRRFPEKDTLWVLDAQQAAAFWQFCAAADERLSRRLEAASVVRASDERLIVRTIGKRPLLVFPFPATGYSPDPRLPGLFVPSDRILKPLLRPREMSHVRGLDPSRVVWLESTAGGHAIPHSAPVSGFRPVAELLEYTAPITDRLECLPRAEPFPLLRCPPLLGETAPSPGRMIVPLPLPAKEESAQPLTRPGWLRRTFGLVSSRLLPRRPRPAAIPPPSTEPPPPALPAGRRIERKIADQQRQ